MCLKVADTKSVQSVVAMTTETMMTMMQDSVTAYLEFS